MLSPRIIFIFETEGVINALMILGNHYSTLALGRSGSKGFHVPGGLEPVAAEVGGSADSNREDRKRAYPVP